jgi:signal peptidase I
VSSVIDILTWPFAAPIRWCLRQFSAEEKMRANAQQWLELADKVYHYRRDRLTNNELSELHESANNLRRLVKEKSEKMKLKLGIESLEGVLRQHGGTHYPKSSLVENIEFFLVAAIVILGFRAYFIQPFKIPTNSMWPSYYGMTPEVFAKPADEPGLLMEGVRFLMFGARPVRVEAPADGEILIPVVGNHDQVAIPYETVSARNWLIFPTTKKQYTLLVGGKPVKLTVPADFDFEWTIRDAFFPATEANNNVARADLAEVLNAQREQLRDNSGRYRFLKTGVNVKQGDRVLAFDVLTGDQLFVERMSYHFFPPKVGQGFVFKTGKIDDPEMKDAAGNQIDQYYVKRLAGIPGDTLEIKNYTLYRNGKPITGAAAFDKNARRVDHYVGYRNEHALDIDMTMTVPANSYLALGDNSANSKDGRYWGYVPAGEVVGRPIFIYYPFTKRWGPSR